MGEIHKQQPFEKTAHHAGDMIEIDRRSERQPVALHNPLEKWRETVFISADAVLSFAGEAADAPPMVETVKGNDLCGGATFLARSRSVAVFPFFRGLPLMAMMCVGSP